MKWLIQIVLPATGTLYLGLDQLWDLPAEQRVVGTILVVTTFLGVIMRISTSNYNKSDDAYDGKVVVINTPEGGKTFSLELNDDPANIENMDSLRFKVAASQE